MKLNKVIIYNGTFQAAATSVISNLKLPVFYIDFTGSTPGCIEIDYTETEIPIYSIWYLGQLPDPRNNKDIYAYLKKKNKIQ